MIAAACVASLLVAGCDVEPLEPVTVHHAVAPSIMQPISCAPAEYHEEHFAWLRSLGVHDPDHLDDMEERCAGWLQQQKLETKIELYYLMMIDKGVPADEAWARTNEFRQRLLYK